MSAYINDNFAWITMDENNPAQCIANSDIEKQLNFDALNQSTRIDTKARVSSADKRFLGWQKSVDCFYEWKVFEKNTPMPADG